jgi:hypothetical protein
MKGRTMENQSAELETTYEPAVVELVAEPDPFLPLAARRVLYVAGLAAVVVAPILAVQFPDYAAAVLAAGAPLTAAALGTALANPKR